MATTSALSTSSSRWGPFPSPDPDVRVEIVDGDLLDQEVDAIVNAWNRNIIPWWLLIPQGVSRAIKKRGGNGPFKEVARLGPIPLGHAVLTSAGTLPYKAIIHVAGINMLWRASEASIRSSTKNAILLAEKEGFKSVAMPLIGGGTGGIAEEEVVEMMSDELSFLDLEIQVKLVRFRPI